MARIVNIFKCYCNNFFSSTEACACEGSTLSITCPSGSTISVKTALYGRTVSGSVYCLYMNDASNAANNVPASGCVTPNAGDKAIIVAACDGQQTCSVSVSGTFSPDPCNGIYKYLRVTYTCDTSTPDPIGFQLGKHKGWDWAWSDPGHSFRMCLKDVISIST